jgi:hypothetical protein
MTVDYNFSINACYTEILVNRMGLSWMITSLCWLWGVKVENNFDNVPLSCSSGIGGHCQNSLSQKQKWNMKLRIYK